MEKSDPLGAIALVRWFGAKTQIDRAGAVFGFRTAATAWVAFVIASFLHVQNAYWAAMAAWIVMQPTRGILIERGFYRVIGSIIGAAAGFAILHWVHKPYLAVGVLAGWVGASAALAHLFRRVRSYGATLAGITAIVVVMPTLHASQQTLELASARVICTLIGVAVATASGILFVPASPQEVFHKRLRELAGDVVAFAASLLRSTDAKSSQRKAQALLEEMVALEQALLVNTAGMWKSQQRVHHFNAFIGATLEVMAAAQAIEDGHRARMASQTIPEAALFALDALSRRLRDTLGKDELVSIVGSLAELPNFDARLQAALNDLLAAESDVLAAPPTPDDRGFGMAAVAPDKDFDIACMSGFAAWLAVWLAGSVALASGWHFAPLAALGVGNFVMVLSGMERPHLMAPKIFLGVTLGVVAATVFRVFVLPHAQTTADVLIMVIPFMVLGALLRASRATSLPAVDFNMCFLLAGQPFLPAETSISLILQSGGALILGIGLVATGHILLPRDPGKRVRNIARLIVRDIERMADLAQDPGEGWRQLTAHRLIRLTVHLSRMENLQAYKPEVVLAALNLGYAVRDLRELLRRPDLALADRALIGEAIAGLRRLASAPNDLIILMKGAGDLARRTGHPTPSSRAVCEALGRTSSALVRIAPLLRM